MRTSFIASAAMKLGNENSWYPTGNFVGGGGGGYGTTEPVSSRESVAGVVGDELKASAAAP